MTRVLHGDRAAAPGSLAPAVVVEPQSNTVSAVDFERYAIQGLSISHFEVYESVREGLLEKSMSKWLETYNDEWPHQRWREIRQRVMMVSC